MSNPKRVLTRPRRTLKAGTANTVIGVGTPRPPGAAAPMALPEEVPTLEHIQPIANHGHEAESGVSHRLRPISTDLEEDWEPTEVWQSDTNPDAPMPSGADGFDENTEIHARRRTTDRPSFDDAVPTTVWDTGAHPSPPKPVSAPPLSGRPVEPLPSIIIQEGRPEQASRLRLIERASKLRSRPKFWLFLSAPIVLLAAYWLFAGGEPEKSEPPAEAIKPAPQAKPTPAEPKEPAEPPAPPPPAWKAGDKPNHCDQWTQSVDGQDPRQGKAAWRMARKALQKGDSARAEEMLCLSTHFAPDGPGSADLIRFYFQKGDPQAAQRWAQWALAQSPDDAALALLLVDAHLQLNQTAEARALVLETLKLDSLESPKLARVAARYANGGFKALNSRDPAQAERLFRRAVLLAPDNSLANAGMARIWLSEKELQQALRSAEVAVKTGADSYHAHLVMGDVQKALGDSTKAQAAWDRAAALQP